MTRPIILIITGIFSNSFTISYNAFSSSKTTSFYFGLAPVDCSSSELGSSQYGYTNYMHKTSSTSTIATYTIDANTTMRGITYLNNDQEGHFSPVRDQIYDIASTARKAIKQIIDNGYVSIHAYRGDAYNTTYQYITFSETPVINYQATVIGID